ncbi:hypothetical protein CQA66_00555 [Helicobacter aurati]|uniref:Uncharacterized protein n=1 Tax=Helicobacter aurati TaxID=137778 RepID=A0A3D8J876_9HELI|nr:hypothetical protein [Helicobacter aurati]RDU73709.1 hypothetical protein CQA66_00555 [Helicobacter aurati]
MLIFSSLDTSKQFIEITDYADCKTLMADSYAFIRIDNYQKLESYFLLGAELKKQEIAYMVLLDKEAKFMINEFDSTTLSHTSRQYPNSQSYQNLATSKDSHLPLNLIIVMFAHLGASFCLIDNRNFSLLPFAQSLVNHYLLDIKILALVDSYQELQNLHLWRPSISDSYQDLQHAIIGIDGIVEKNLLTYKALTPNAPTPITKICN